MVTNANRVDLEKC